MSKSFQKSQKQIFFYCDYRCFDHKSCSLKFRPKLINKNVVMSQGTLTEGKGTVQLAPSLR
jgi:hypothetical protein